MFFNPFSIEFLNKSLWTPLVIKTLSTPKFEAPKISWSNESPTAVGDSLDHDILGASNFGVDSVLITSGVHKDLFKNSIEKGLKNIENDRKWNFKPTYVCESFSF